MKSTTPRKVKTGDTVRVVAPARSLALPWINPELKRIAAERFKELGLNLTFAKHVNECDEFDSSSIESRVSDLHEAFADNSVNLILTVIGGYNSNQLLGYLDYRLIRDNPKIFCGYSDITALSNAIHAKAGLVTYSGPHYFSFGDKKGFDYTLSFLKKCLLSEDPFLVHPSKSWSDDRWTTDQENRRFLQNEGFWIINEGTARGEILGGNLCTFNLLHGTEFMPDLDSSILFLEDDYESNVSTVDRNLQSIVHQPGFSGVKGIVFGRFQPETGMTRDLLSRIINSKPPLREIPILANVDFGHTTPLITFPIGGVAEMEVCEGNTQLSIVEH